MGCFIIGVFPGQNLWDKRTKVRNFTRSFDLESKASEEQGSRHFVTALARGLAVIQAFDHTRPRMTLAQVAQVVNLPRAAARRSRLTLMDLGYVASEGTLFYATCSEERSVGQGCASQGDIGWSPLH